MNQKFSYSFTFLFGLMSLAACLTTNAYAANHVGADAGSPDAKIPTCAAIAGAVKASYGPVSSFRDQTAFLETVIQTPYHLVRSCQIYAAGHKLPFNITFNEMNVKKVDKLEQVLQEQGRPVQKVDVGWAYPVYMAAENGTGAKAVVSVSPAIALHVTSHHTSVEKTQKMTRAILDLM